MFAAVLIALAASAAVVFVLKQSALPVLASDAADAVNLDAAVAAEDINQTQGSFVGESIVDQQEISANPGTWPSGDKIWQICHAIAYAEGANFEGSNPDRLNNPGDLSDGAGTFGAESHSGSRVTAFPDKQTGWQWLYNKIRNAADGTSGVYSPSITWWQFAKLWAGSDASNSPVTFGPWVRNVTSRLGVSPLDTWTDFLAG